LSTCRRPSPWVLASRSDPPAAAASPAWRAGGPARRTGAPPTCDSPRTSAAGPASGKRRWGELPAAAVAGAGGPHRGMGRGPAAKPRFPLRRGRRMPPGSWPPSSGSPTRYKSWTYLTEEVLDQQPGGTTRVSCWKTSSAGTACPARLCDGGHRPHRQPGDAWSAWKHARPVSPGCRWMRWRGWWRYQPPVSPTCSVPACQQERAPAGCAGPAPGRGGPGTKGGMGLADDAVRHALAAGDTAWTMRLIERHCRRVSAEQPRCATITSGGLCGAARWT